MKHLLIILSILLLSSPVIGQSTQKYESVGQCVLQTMTEKKLTGNQMFELVKDECERSLGSRSEEISSNNNFWIESITGITMIKIPGGRFMMGSSPSETDRLMDNEDQHIVEVDDFWIGETEVTVGQWEKIMDSTPQSWFEGKYLPVGRMTWKLTQVFINKLNNLSGKNFFLPTEAQWEYAARAGTNTDRWWGNEIGVNNAHCRRKDDRIFAKGCGSKWDDEQTAPVGSFRPNPFGLYDMLGNVKEITCSKYVEHYDGNETKCDPKAKFHALRGGGYSATALTVRAARRFYIRRNSSEYPNTSNGFRLAMKAP